MSVLNSYRKARHNATVLADSSDYNLSKGEMNPEIYSQFVELLSAYEADIVYEPFAPSNGSSFEHFEDAGMGLIAHSIAPEDERLFEFDSTVEEPTTDGKPIDGVIFHPPYFGSSAMSSQDGEISLIDNKEEWLVAIESTADIIMDYLSPTGLVCAVGRRYRHNGELIKLDEWLIQAFSDEMEVFEVWLSEPDVAIIMRMSQ